MRIAFITCEYPPDTAWGGIATYTEQVARIMHDRGNMVEVFCGSHTRNISASINGILIHRCLITDVQSFRNDCLNKFVERHQAAPFDIIESPEIFANALMIKEKYPLLPLVVKLHMASFIQMRLLNFYTGSFTKLRYFLGGIRRGRINFFGDYHYKTDIEYAFTILGEGIVAPSLAQKNIIADEWHLPTERITVIPNPFTPPEKLRQIPVDIPVKKVVTFIGKLNVHKGIVNLIKLIRMVAQKHPDVVFRLIGGDGYFDVEKMNMSDYIRQQLKGYNDNYLIMGTLDYETMLDQFETTAVCIFPSIWECFGLVCLEAMSAARPVIGSSEGGMNDILGNGNGVLVNPHDVKQMANAVIILLDEEKLRWHYGNAGRLAVLEKYNKDVVGLQMEKHYQLIIGHSKKV